MADTVSVPHRVRYSFDLASCPCGWYDASDNQERLHVGGEAHEEAHEGHVVRMEAFTPDG
jgi:hypothetical protein